MKKTTRVLVALLALTLVTSCFVGGTFAKYVTEANGTDTARVAKFGVVLSAGSDVFAPEYDGNDAISVLADDTADVVAPGTEGEMVAFTIDGAPEVDVQLDISLDVDDSLAMVSVPAGDYLDWTTGDDDADTYNVAADYYPVVWTLTQDGTEVVKGNLAAIEAELAAMSKKYNVEGDEFDALNGEWKLSWAWAFEGNDKADTTLGQKAAGVTDATAGAVTLNETFKFNIKVTQID